MNAIGFKYKPSEKARSLGGGHEVSSCLSSETHDAAICYDGYNQKTYEEVSMTMRSAMTGHDGNDADPKVCYGFSHSNSNTSLQTKPSEECGMTIRSVPTGEGAMVQVAKADGVAFDAQKGFPVADGIAQTQRNGAAPGHETGVVVGFKAGQSKDGGLGDEREVSPTLSHKPSALEPTLAQSTFVRIGSITRRDRPTPPSEEVAHALTKTDGDAGDNAASVVQSLAQMRYIVRRLTPTEAERLMGIPDGYTIPTDIQMTDETVEEFQRIFDTFGAIMAEYEKTKPPKPKSANQVRAWLEKITNPETCPDSPRYRCLGNGWATNQPRWILLRLLDAEGIDPFTGEEYETQRRPNR